MNNEFNQENIITLLKNLKIVFDTVRLVEPVSGTQLVLDGNSKLVQRSYKCYAFWKNSDKCENCISARVVKQKTRLSKYEFVDDEIFYVVSKYVNVDGKDYALEILSKATDEILLGAFGKNELVDKIQKYNDKIYKDALTGAYNRSYYDEKELSLLRMNCIAMLDVDGFKQINDTYGHKEGDKLLKSLAECVQSNIRSQDRLIRYEGDEFLICFSKMKKDMLFSKLDSLRKSVSEHISVYSHNVPITVCIGGCYSEDRNIDKVEIADRMLYKAKEEKDKVCCEFVD